MPPPDSSRAPSRSAGPGPSHALLAHARTAPTPKVPRTNPGPSLNEPRPAESNPGMDLVSAAPSSFSVERARKPLSFAFAAFYVLGLIFTLPGQFESVAYEIMEMIGYGMLITAALGRIWATLYIGGRKNRELCCDGPYSLTRNPLYLFTFLGVVGIGIAAQNPLFATVAAVAFLGLHRFVIAIEEQRLEQLFGAAFRSYCLAVPRFFPRFRRPSRPDQITLVPRFFERGLTEVVWFLVAIVAVEVLESLHHSHAWRVYPLPF